MSRKKCLSVLLLMVFVLTLAVGCGQQTGGDNKGGKEGAEGAYPLTMTDAAGREVTLEARPERIVSLMPSLTEIVFALEADERLVGVTSYCDYPEAAKEKEDVGDLFNLNTEKILSLEPDLVLVGKSETLQDSMEFLEEAGVPYFVVDPQTLDEIEESILTVAELIDAKEEGEALVTQLRADRAAFEEKVAAIPAEERPNVFVLLDTEALYTVGDGEYLSEMITVAGGNNVAAEIGAGYFQISEEKLLEIDPDIIINTFPMRDQVMAKEAWQDLSAIKNKRVYDVESNAVSRPGPRYVQGLEEFYKVFTAK